MKMYSIIEYCKKLQKFLKKFKGRFLESKFSKITKEKKKKYIRTLKSRHKLLSKIKRYNKLLIPKF